MIKAFFKGCFELVVLLLCLTSWYWALMVLGLLMEGI